MNVIEQLDAAYAAATPGEWGVKLPSFGGGLFISPKQATNAACAIAKILGTDEGPIQANAHLIALAHNALPALIEAARALEDMQKDWQLAAEHRSHMTTFFSSYNRGVQALAKLKGESV